MKILDEYMRLQKEIFSYFNFVGDWVVPPIDDRRKYYWMINGGERRDGEVIYAESVESIEDDDGDYYCDSIYTQRFYDKWVYRGENYTMIMVDTHTDGNRFLAIYDNEKELTEI